METQRPFARIAVRVAAVALLATGCAVHRELVILSDPPGASVRLDQQMVGVTPYRTEFEAFGTRRVTLYRQGFRAWAEPVELKAPWYDLFPFDFFSEVLLGCGAGQRLDPPDPGGDRRLAADLEEPDVARAVDMGAAAELNREWTPIVGLAAHRNDPYLITVFLAEEGERALRDGLIGGQ